MASDNLMATEQPWMLRPPFADAWIADMFTKESDALARALQKSISTESSDGMAEMESLFAKPFEMASASGCSESEAPMSKPQHRRGGIPPIGGKITKRKSRASKRAVTTFITADPANFRQMVQQVTGVRFGGVNGGGQMAEPQRSSISWIQQGSAALPGIDTSAFFLDGSAVAPTHMAVANDGGPVIDFDSFCSFPTLESSKVM